MSETSSAPSERLTVAMTMLYLVIVIISWGTNYPLMKLAMQDMPPLTFSAVRLFGGAIVVTTVLLACRAPRLLPPNDELVGLAGIGILQFASVLGLAGIALLVLPAGRTVTAIYSMPLWAALFDILLLRSRLAPIQIAGVVVSLSGLLLFLDPSVVDWSAPGVALGTALALTAAMLWGLGAVLYRARRWSAPLLSQTLWQLLTAGVTITVMACIFESSTSVHFSTRLWIILLWNWLVPTALAVWAWSKVLNRLPASMAGQFLMCTPFVGIAASAWLFDENLPPAFAGSTVLIAIGGMMVLIRRSRPVHGNSGDST